MKPAALALISVFLIATSHLLFADGLSNEKNNTVLPTISPENQDHPALSGTFEPYGLYNKAKVTATILANPGKMDDVTVGYAYNASDIAKNLEAVKDVEDLIASGSAALAVSEGKNLVVLKNEKFAQCKPPEERCAGSVFSDALMQYTGEAKDALRVISIDASLSKDAAKYPVINWDSKSRN